MNTIAYRSPLHWRSIGRFAFPLWIGLLLSLTSQPVGAAPYGLRFFINPPSQVSTASRFSTTVQLYDQATNNPILTSDVHVTLALVRCPSFPSCSPPDIINTSFASDITTYGEVTFSNLVVDTVNSDYYFTASASGYSSGNSALFDVLQAAVRFDAGPPSEVSTASRFPLQVSIHRGTGIGAPVDILADGVAVPLDLFHCASFPTCLATPVITNFVSVGTTDGVATYSNIHIDTVDNDYYFHARVPSVPSASLSNSSLFDVVQAVVRLETPLYNVNVGQTFPVQAVIRRGVDTYDPIDTLADNLNVHLALRRCPGFPSFCIPTAVISTFDATATDGIANFNLSIGTAATDYYFEHSVTTLPNIEAMGPFDYFDVLNPAYYSLYFTIQGRPAGSLGVPMHVIMKRTDGEPGIDTTLLADNSGYVLVIDVVPGTYDIWMKDDLTLARTALNIPIASGNSSRFMGDLKGGDSNNSNSINILDFSILAATFGKSSGQAGYDARADFNGDGSITILDFSILASNFGQTGAAVP